jgi:hypothetical protein
LSYLADSERALRYQGAPNNYQVVFDPGDYDPILSPAVDFFGDHLTQTGLLLSFG